MARSKDEVACRDVDMLIDPFRPTLIKLQAKVTERDYPFEIEETIRTISRQTYLYKTGESRAAGLKGPHPHGLACDWKLILTHKCWVELKERPREHDGGGAAWDTGVELVGKDAVVLRPGVLRAWILFGELVKELGLEWGGDKTLKGWAPAHPGDPLGWDPGHVQQANWRGFLPQ